MQATEHEVTVTEDWLVSIGFVPFGETKFQNPPSSHTNLKMGRLIWRCWGRTFPPVQAEYSLRLGVEDLGVSPSRGFVLALISGLGIVAEK